MFKTKSVHFFVKKEYNNKQRVWLQILSERLKSKKKESEKSQSKIVEFKIQKREGINKICFKLKRFKIYIYIFMYNKLS